MESRENAELKPKPKPKQRVLNTKTTVTNAKAKSSPVNTTKKAITTRTTISTKNVSDKNMGKVNSQANEPIKEKLGAGITKSAKKPQWKRKPKPAHSGVPIPVRMKEMFKKQLQQSEKTESQSGVPLHI